MLPNFKLKLPNTLKKPIPMKQEAAPAQTVQKPRKPNFVRWRTVDGRLKRDWFPGFLAPFAPAGWAVEGSPEEAGLKARQCEAPF